jgi:hypothetical protein
MALNLDETEDEPIISEDESVVESLTSSAKSSGNGNDKKILERFKGTTRPQPSVQGIMSAGTYGPQAASTYFPSAHVPINIGQYSGSMIGSNPIFAPSQLYPFGLIDARKQALAAAADAKVADQEKWADKMANIQSPETERTAVQPTITKNFYEGMKAQKARIAKQYPGQDVNKATMRDPEFNKWLDDQRDLTKHEDRLVHTVANFQKEAESTGNTVYGPQKEMMNKFNSNQLWNGLQSVDPNERENAKKELAQINSMKALPDVQIVAAKIKEKVDPDDIETLQGITQEQGFQLITTGSTKGISNPEAAKRVNDHLEEQYNTHYKGYEDQTGFGLPEFKAMVLSQYGTTKKKTVQTVKDEKDGSGLDFKFTPNAVEKETKTIKSSYTNKDGKVTIQENIPTEDGFQLPTAKSITASVSTKWYDVGDSKGGNIAPSKPTGQKDVMVSEVRNIPTYDLPGSKSDGWIMDEKALAEAKEKGYGIKYRTFAVGNIGGDESSKDDFKQKTVFIPVEEIKGSLEVRDKDDKFIKGIDTKFYEEQAEKRSVKAGSGQAAAKANAKTIKVGDTDGEYTFKGGDPKVSTNWVKNKK